MSLDEAYINLTSFWKQHGTGGDGKYGSPEDIVTELRSKVFEKTQLTCSAGIAPNSMLAKIASDRNKPNGQYTVACCRNSVLEFMSDLPVRKIPGVGKVAEKELHAVGIETCKDVLTKCYELPHAFRPLSVVFFLRSALGVSSREISCHTPSYNLSFTPYFDYFGKQKTPEQTSKQSLHAVRHGNGMSFASSSSKDSDRKSLGVERTFHNESDSNNLLQKCKELAEALSEELREKKLAAKTITLKLKTADFDVKARSKTLPNFTASGKDIFRVSSELLHLELPICLRLMGIRVKGFRKQRQAQDTTRPITSYFNLDEGQKCNTQLATIRQAESSDLQKTRTKLSIENFFPKIQKKDSSTKERSTTFAVDDKEKTEEKRKEEVPIVSPQFDCTSPMGTEYAFSLSPILFFQQELIIYSSLSSSSF